MTLRRARRSKAGSRPAPRPERLGRSAPATRRRARRRAAAAGTRPGSRAPRGCGTGQRAAAPRGPTGGQRTKAQAPAVGRQRSDEEGGCARRGHEPLEVVSRQERRRASPSRRRAARIRRRAGDAAAVPRSRSAAPAAPASAATSASVSCVMGDAERKQCENPAMLSAAKRALVLAPHTDDGEFGCGGTMARLVEQGVEVRYVAFSIADEVAARGLRAGHARPRSARGDRAPRHPRREASTSTTSKCGRSPTTARTSSSC